jgi:hypothetical protein
LDMSYFGGIVQLVSCQQLTCLQVHHEDPDGDYGPIEYSLEVSFWLRDSAV